MTPSRPLIIPHKRALLPPMTNTRHNNLLIPKVLNTNTTPSETHLNQPPTSSTGTTSHQSTTPDHPPTQITELPFAAHSQPFLDPPTWASMTKRRARTPMSIPRGEGEGEREGEGIIASARGGGGLAPSAPETADQRRSRREWEAEFGAMAIRGRSRGRGRGRV